MSVHRLSAIAALVLALGSHIASGGPDDAVTRDPDAFNLGVLGAEGNPTKEPSGIKIAAVHKEGPAAAGGLQEGDHIIAVGGATFPKNKDAIHAFVEFLEKASSRKGATLTLNVLRAGKHEAVKITLPFLGPHVSSCPSRCVRCEKMIDGSLAFLANLQKENGAFESKLGGTSGAVVVTSLCGLALLASGSTPEDGPYAEHIRKAMSFVTENAGKDDKKGREAGEPNWNQTNWSLGYAPIFLVSYLKKKDDPAIRKRLEEISAKIVENQERSGGWAHGPGGPNALNYLELEVMSNVCLTALGLMNQIGIKPPGEAVERAIRYVEECSDGGGGVGYSTRDGQKGMGDPGRTAGAIVALWTLGRQRHPLFGKMAAYYTMRIGDLVNGHVSPVMHCTSGGIAAHLLGPKVWAKFMQPFRLEFMAARRPDGGFSARPTEETRQLRSNTDRSLGDAWTTASYLLILQLPKGRLAF
ncbi:MAG: PDZ domain-containing protein [Planctomycetes bacterium]|nr:PDZ domain-containing protein [Planctomycetota bacterium]